MAKWLIYAMGGGWGHLTRALGLARQAIRDAPQGTLQVEILTNSSLAQFLQQHPEAVLISLPTQVHIQSVATPREKAVAQVRQTLQRRDYDLLLVDSFPRGLVGEFADLLPQLDVPKVLIHRDITPQYVARNEVRQAAQLYDRILLPGDSAPLEGWPTAYRTKPWIACSPKDILSADTARQRLQVTSQQPVVVCLASGKPEEVEQMVTIGNTLVTELNETCQVRVIAAREQDSCLQFWPAICLHAGIDLLVGGGGFNTVHETRATGTSLLAFARPRMYDRQQLRLAQQQIIDPKQPLASQVVAALSNTIQPRPHFENGLQEGVRLCHELTQAT